MCRHLRFELARYLKIFTTSFSFVLTSIFNDLTTCVLLRSRAMPRWQTALYTICFSSVLDRLIKHTPCALFLFEPGSGFQFSVLMTVQPKAWLFPSLRFSITPSIPIYAIPWKGQRFVSLNINMPFHMFAGLMFITDALLLCFMHCASGRSRRMIHRTECFRTLYAQCMRRFRHVCGWVACIRCMDFVDSLMTWRMVEECIWLHDWGSCFLQCVTAGWDVVEAVSHK